MIDDQHDGHLGAVYGATRPEQLATIYDGWAETYDAEMAACGYRHPTICAALVARYLPRGSAPLLDAGAGTGLMGEWLAILGYPHVEALDISAGMLSVAAKKGVYAALHTLALGGPLPFASSSFAGMVSTGVFTTGHVGPDALDELIRIVRPGGALVFSVKDTVWEAGFAGHVDTLIGAGLVRLAEQTSPYISMPGEPGTTPGRCIVLKVTD